MVAFKKLFKKSSDKPASLPAGDVSFNGSTRGKEQRVAGDIPNVKKSASVDQVTYEVNKNLPAPPAPPAISVTTAGINGSGNGYSTISASSSSSSSNFQPPYPLSQPQSPSFNNLSGGSRTHHRNSSRQQQHHRISSVPTSFLRQRSDSNSSNSASNNASPHQRSRSSNKADPAAILDNEAVPKELVPIITLIQAQQARIYFDDFLKIDGAVVESKLSGTELSFWSALTVEPTYVNIADAIFQYSATELSLIITLNQSKIFNFVFDNAQELNFFYSCVLLSQFEYRQLQESFTGALLSAKGVLLSDIRTLLAPENRYVKTEWCVIRFPFLNNKWIRCYTVVIPGEKTLLKNSSTNSKEKPGKIEIYTSSKLNKNNLLATIINGRSCYSIYPERPEFIDNNALLHITGRIYINQDKLNELTTAPNAEPQNMSKKNSSTSLNKLSSPILSAAGVFGGNKDAAQSGSNNGNIRSRSSSLVGHSYHQRSESTQSLDSEASSISKNIKNVNLVTTPLCLLIPDTHPSVKQFDTMIRLLIPILNVFKLYGRPTKFLSQRDDKRSLLFGLPQLPHTEYLDIETAYKLVDLNIQNSVAESWNNDDWVQVFKEMILFKLTKGYKGSGSVFDVFRDGLMYSKNKNSDEDIYLSDNEALEFIDMGSDPHSGLSTPRNTFIDRSRSSSFQQPNANDYHLKSGSIHSRLNSPLNGSGEMEQNTGFSHEPVVMQSSHDYRAMLNVPSQNPNSLQQNTQQLASSPLANEYLHDISVDTTDTHTNHSRSFSNSTEDQTVLA